MHHCFQSGNTKTFGGAINWLSGLESHFLLIGMWYLRFFFKTIDPLDQRERIGGISCMESWSMDMEHEQALLIGDLVPIRASLGLDLLFSR